MAAYKWKATYNDGVETAECNSNSSITQNEIAIANLKKVEVGNCVDNIGYRAFYGCNTLTSATIPTTITEIDLGAFTDSKIKELSDLNNVISIGDYAFENCTELISITIPNNVVRIDDFSFNNCSELTSVTLGNSIGIIGNYAFNKCSKIKRIEIPNSVTAICSYAFAFCSSMTSLTISNDVSRIGENAFRGCTSLTSLTIPSGVETIGSYAFYRCSSLTSITVNNATPAKLGIYAFSETNNCPILVPTANVNEYREAWSYYADRINPSPTPPPRQTRWVVADYFCDGTTYKAHEKEQYSDDGGMTWHDFSPSHTRVKVIEYNSSHCQETIRYRWYRVNTYCQNGNLMAHEKRQYSTDGGITWSDVTPSETQDIVVEYSSSQCQAIYKWEPVYEYCQDSNLMEHQVYMYSDDGGVTWKKVVPEQTREEVREYSSVQCSFDAYKWLATYNGGTTTSAECGSSTVISIREVSKEGLGRLVVGNCVRRIKYNAFQSCESLTSLEFGENINTIEEYAFMECNNLVEVKFPNSIENIGVDCFYKCTNLTNVVIGNGINSIGNGAFNHCKSLEKITITKPHPFVLGSGQYNEYVFNDTNECPIYVPTPSVDEYKETWPIYAHRINPITPIPTEYKWYSLYEDGSLRSKDCESSTFIVKNEVPKESVMSINIGDCVTLIGTEAFYGYENLKEVTMSDSVTTLLSSCFDSCVNLTNITLSKNITSIDTGAFYECTRLESIEIPTSLTTIGEKAFMKCSSIEELTIPSNVEVIDNSAFERCNSLTSLTIEDGVLNIGNYSFAVCTSLTSVTIPNSVERIGEYAFFGCPSLIHCIIGNGITEIAPHAFYDCNNVVGAIVRADTPPSTTSSSFGELLTYPIYVKSDKVEAYKSAWPYYAHRINPMPYDYKWRATYNNGDIVTAEWDFTDTISSGEVKKSGLVSIDINECVTVIKVSAFTECDTLESISIPNSVTSIERFAFDTCSSLTSCTIPSGVTSIESYTFEYCSNLISVDIPSGVTKIDICAFMNCRSLERIDIPSGVTTLGSYAFYGCSSLTSIEIPSGITTLSTNMLSYCSSLTSCTVPSGVTRLEYGVFYDCTSLESITFEPLTPPHLGGNVLEHTNNCPIYVNSESVTEYREAWPAYASRIQAKTS